MDIGTTPQLHAESGIQRRERVSFCGFLCDCRGAEPVASSVIGNCDEQNC
jgi:hypothetical protein